jgi:hypothetical protein
MRALDTNIHVRVDQDVAYLHDLAAEVLSLSTTEGRETCGRAAQSEDGRDALQSLLSANERWRVAMLSVIQAIETTNVVLRLAIDGEPVDALPVH